MVAAFLQAEVHSSRFGDNVRNLAARWGLSLTAVKEPDITDVTENRLRSLILRDFRGWGQNAFLFAGWPRQLSWRLVTIATEDIPRLRYAAAPEWVALSRGTGFVHIGAQRVREQDPTVVGDERYQSVLGIVASLQAGTTTFPPSIMIGTPKGECVVVVEGHSRVTAFVAEGRPQQFEVIYGSAPVSRLSTWGWFPHG